jgi:hypothetical protein
MNSTKRDYFARIGLVEYGPFDTLEAAVKEGRAQSKRLGDNGYIVTFFQVYSTTTTTEEIYVEKSDD